MFDTEDICDYPVEYIINEGRKGMVKDIPAIFFDKLQDYIDEKEENNG